MALKGLSIHPMEQSLALHTSWRVRQDRDHHCWLRDSVQSRSWMEHHMSWKEQMDRVLRCSIPS